MRLLRWETTACIGCALALLGGAGRLAAQEPDSLRQPSVLKEMTLEELMDVEVTSVSRRPERLSETASAIQVISGEELRRAGVSTLPEALRLAANLQVAQANASQWAVSARGFTNVLANKLLVLIDGRTVYTPLYAGVFWDVQNTLLDDVEQIEIISGPGSALWGANAVNGVINVVTRDASETQGLLLKGGGGSELHGFGGLRYGGKLSPSLSYRVYGKGFRRGSTMLGTGAAAGDEWSLGQGGFRTDWASVSRDHVTVQGDLYGANPNPDGGAGVTARGGNLIGRWSHTVSDQSDFRLQLYYDRTWRDFRNGFTEALATYDADWQHRFHLGGRQEIVWGAGSRLMDHKTENLPSLRFLPARRLLRLYTGFIQDEITLVDKRLRLSLGSKFEHNDYTGWEIQPGARLAWTPQTNQTVWAAVSRGVRTPSRIDRDFSLLVSPTLAFITGANFQSEEVLAYELGWRLQAEGQAAVSISTFYNEYDHLRSAEPGPPPLGLPITFGNGVAGHTYGVELATVWQPVKRWRLRGGYTFLEKRLTVQPGSQDQNRASVESDDPGHQALLQSSLDLPGGIEWETVVRRVGALPSPVVDGYSGLDARLGWRPVRQVELAVVGQNLLHSKHREFRPTSPSPRLIERSVYGQLTLRW